MRSGQLNPAQLMMSYLSTEQGKISDKISTQEFSRELEAQSNLGSGCCFAPASGGGAFAQGFGGLLKDSNPDSLPEGRQLFASPVDPSAKDLSESRLKALQRMTTQKKPLQLAGDKVREDLAFGNSVVLEKVLAQLRVPAEVRQALKGSEDKQGRIPLKNVLSVLEQTTLPQENIAGQLMVPAQDVQELLGSLSQFQPDPRLQLQTFKAKPAGMYSMGELHGALESIVREVAVQTMKMKQQTAGSSSAPRTTSPGGSSLDKELSGASAVSPDHVEKLTTNLMPTFSGSWDWNEERKEGPAGPVGENIPETPSQTVEMESADGNASAVQGKMVADEQTLARTGLNAAPSSAAPSSVPKVTNSTSGKAAGLPDALPQSHEPVAFDETVIIRDLSRGENRNEFGTALFVEDPLEAVQGDKRPDGLPSTSTVAVDRSSQAADTAELEPNLRITPASIPELAPQTGDDLRLRMAFSRLAAEPSFAAAETVQAQPESAQKAYAAGVDLSLMAGRKQDRTEGPSRTPSSTEKEILEPAAAFPDAEIDTRRVTAPGTTDGTLGERPDQSEEQPASDLTARAGARTPSVEKASQRDPNVGPPSEDRIAQGERPRGIEATDRLSPMQPHFAREGASKQLATDQMVSAADMNSPPLTGSNGEGAESVWRKEGETEEVDFEPVPVASGQEGKPQKIASGHLGDGSFGRNGREAKDPGNPDFMAQGNGEQAVENVPTGESFDIGMGTSVAGGPQGTVSAQQSTQTSSESSLALNHSNWTSELTDKFTELIRQKKNQITLELEPRNMGKLVLRIETDHNQVHAWVSADNEQVKTLLTQNSPVLKQHLEQQGLVLTQFTVDVKQQKEQSRFARSTPSSRGSRTLGSIRDGEASETMDSTERVYGRRLDGQTLSVFA